MRIFSGIQPTGAKHLGNYAGGFRQYAATQELGEAFFCIVDLHSISQEHSPDELRRSTLDLAASFNSRYGETFTLPRVETPPVGGRIMDLQQPERKISTTGGTPQGTVLIVDPPDVVRRKFKTAVTDTGREVARSPEKPGITNLIEIMSVATGDPPDQIEARYDGQGYAAFKEEVAEAVIALLDPVRTRYDALASDPGELERLLAVGAEKAREASAPTLARMYDAMGFVRP